jgi:hypothetical protein
MNKPFPAYCKDCAHSKPDTDDIWDLRCHHPEVNAKDAWALAHGKGNGASCHTERQMVGFWSVCGQRGAKWEAK